MTKMFRLFYGSLLLPFILMLEVLADSHGYGENELITSTESVKTEKKKFQRATSDRTSGKNNGMENGNVFVKSSFLGNIKLEKETDGGGTRKRASPGFEKFEKEAILTLQQILKDHTVLGTGKERFQSSRRYNSFVEDPVNQHKHLRFEQTTSDGLPVVGAAMMMHVDEKGNVYAVNGEFVPEDDNPEVYASIVKNCEEAFQGVLEQTRQQYNAMNVTWLSADATACELKVVVDKDGVGHKAWERMIGFQPFVASDSTTGKGLQPPYQMNILYASVVTGRIVAVHPQVMGALSIETLNCMNSWGKRCVLVSKSPTKISSGDQAVDNAHNYAIDTYEFYQEQFGRDSLDNMGLKLVNFAHFGKNYNNAFWNGAMVYGDGDGDTFDPLSMSIEIVAHELTHGVTQYTSGLVYSDESGALNEALSDIFGATVSRVKGGQTPNNVWKLAEGVWTPTIAGDAMRYMNNPVLSAGYDYYFERYVGWDDNGGVHMNSGIANLAFYLLVSGGSHPRLPSRPVAPLDPDFDVSILSAARIFYLANTACLTPNSGFHAARKCTMLHAGSAENAQKVSAAWQIVGVSTDGIPLTNGVPLTDLNAPADFTSIYVLDEIPPWTEVTCKGDAVQGSFDLEVDLVSFAGPTDHCTSSSAGSACTVGPTRSEGTVLLEVQTRQGFQGGTIQCEFQSTSTWPFLKDSVTFQLDPEAEGSRQLFQFKVALKAQGDVLTCSSIASTAVALYVNLTSSSTDDFSCSGLEGPILGCSVDLMNFEQAMDVSAFILVSSFYGYGNAGLTCSIVQPTHLANDVTLWDQSASSVGGVKTYVLESIPENYYVQCNIEGDNGDADLLVNLQVEGSEGNACSSLSSESNESCTVGPTKKPETKAFVNVFASSTYSGLSLTCRMLKFSAPACDAPEGSSCILDEDCCEAGKSLRCHPKKGKCMACKTTNSQCKKSKECCSGKCIGSRKRGGKRCK